MDNYRRWLVIITISVLAAGWLGMNAAVKLTEEELQSKLLLRAITAAATISYDRVDRLTGTAADGGTEDYLFLREQLLRAQQLNSDCRYVYLLKMAEGRMVFPISTEPEDSPEYTPPGYEYKDASAALRQIFVNGQPFVEGPLSDEWGTWMSGLAAVREPADGRIIAVVGIDIAASDWLAAIATTRLIVLGLTLTVLLMLYALFYAMHTTANAARRVYLAEKQAKEALETVSQAKSKFMAYLSHELRTPVSGILGLGELLQTTALDSRQRDYLSAMEYSARSLLTVINEVLDFSKIEADKLQVDSVEFAFRPVLKNTVAMLQANALNKGLELSTVIAPELPALVVGDPARLQQVLLNLAGNAIKFTESGKVEIAAICLRQDDERVEVQIIISDTGIGLEPAEIDKLFQPFSQAEGGNVRKYLGTGLGLSISASLVKLMGGEIGVTSRKGEGSSFWFSLPLRVAKPELAAAGTGPAGFVQPADALPAWLAQPVTGGRAGGEVLVVEDNPIIQQVVGLQLKHLGLTADSAGNGQEAVEKALKTDYKLIFMDCGLPLLDGMAATRLIREKEALVGRHTPIIALTGNSLPEEQQQCLAEGMDDCLVKPVSIEDIRQAVARWLPARPDETIDLAVLRQLKQLADGGLSSLDVFIDAYLEELPLLIGKLNQAMAAGDAAAVRAAAHSLKSMNGTIGAKRLSELFCCLEELAKHDSKHNQEQAVRLMHSIEAECKQVETALKQAAGSL